MTLPGGETVGTAYIRLLADGSGLERSTREKFDENRDTVGEAGARDSEAYNKEFQDRDRALTKKYANDRSKRIDTFEKQRAESLARNLAKYEQSLSFFGDDSKYKKQLKGVRETLEKTFGGDLGRTIFQNLRNEAEKVGNVEVFDFKNLPGQIQRARAQIEAERRRQLKGVEDVDKAHRQAFKQDEARTYDQAATQNRLFDQRKKFINDITKAERQAYKEDQGRARDQAGIDNRLYDDRHKAYAKLFDDIERNKKETFSALHDEAVLEDRIHTIRRARATEIERLERDAYRFDRDRTLRLAREKERIYNKLLQLDRKKNAYNKRTFEAESYYNKGYGKREREKFNLAYKEARLEAERTGDLTRALHLARERNKVGDDYVNKQIRGNGLIRGGQRKVYENERKLARLSDKVNKRLEGVGKAFGKGSRNNFFNAIGGAIEGLTRTISRGTLLNVQRLARGIGNVRGVLTDNKRSKLGKIFGLADLAVNSLLNGMLRLVSATGKGFAALNALFFLAGPLASALSLLGGGISAIAGTLVNGLIGGIIPLLGLLPVATFAIATLGIAFAGLDKKARAALAVRLKPIVDEYKTLREAVRTTLFDGLNDQAKNIGRVLKRITPLLAATGTGIGKAIGGFSKELLGKPFKEDLKVFNKFIPDAIERLGKISGKYFVGLAGYFRIIAPYTTRMLKNLEKSGDAFVKFTHSADGKNRIVSYTDRALKSFAALKKLTGALYRVFRDLFKAGQDAGDSLTGSITSSLNRFDKYLTNPKNAKEIRGYFKDVVTFFGSLGKALGGLGRLFDRLDDAQSRSSANGALKILGAVAGAIGDALPIISAFQRAIKDVLKDLSGPLHDLFTNIRPLVKLIAGEVATATLAVADVVASVLKPILEGLANIAKFMSEHKDIFGPLIASLLALKTLAIAGSVYQTVLFSVNRLIFGLQNSIAAGTTTIGGLVGKLGKAVGGIGIALGGVAVGQSIGGKKGALVSIAAGAAGGALAGSAFGPYGAAIGGLIGGVSAAIYSFGKLGDASEKAKAKIAQNMKDNAEATDAFTEALKRSKGRIGPDVRQEAINRLDKKGTLSTLNDIGINPNDFVDAGLGNKRKYFTQYRELRALNASGRISDSTFRSLVETLNQTEAALYGATKRSIAYQRTLDNGIGSVPKITTLTAQYGNKLDLTGLKLNAATKALSSQTIAGAKNVDGIRRNLTSYQQFADKQLKLGKSADTVRANFENSRSAFRDQLIGLGFQSKAVDILFKAYGKLPKSVTTKLKVEDEARAKIAYLTEALSRYPLNKSTKLIAQDIASGKITTIGQLLQRLKDKNIRINALGVTSATQEVQALRAQLGKLAAVNVTLNKRGSIGGVNANGQISIVGGGRYASGTIANRATPGIFGEAGPEALVPLRRPLSQVDPSVRALSAFAQGLDYNGSQQKFASGGVVTGSGRTVNIAPGAIQVITPTRDPAGVALEVLSRVSARAGLG